MEFLGRTEYTEKDTELIRYQKLIRVNPCSPW
jgi:hypothetical protein